jgi:hypothetical protein
LFDFDKAAAAPEDFVDALENILQLVDIWADRVNGNSKAEAQDAENGISKASDSSSTIFLRP